MRSRFKSKRRISSTKVSNYFRSSYQVILLTLLILIGIIIGSFIAKTNGVQNQSSFSFFMQNAFYSPAASKGFVSILTSTFFSSAMLICIAFFLGLSAYGSPFIALILVYKGVGIGLSIGSLYLQYGFKGFVITASCILPEAILTCIALIVACREGIRFSAKLASVVLPTEKEVHLWSDFLEYCFKFVVCFVIVFAASILNALVTTGLSGILF